MPMRWTEDTLGHGVASGEALLPAVDALRAAMTDATWVAEQPEAHLLPHILAHTEREAARWLLVHTALEDAVLVVRLRWQSTGNPAALGADALALIGSFSEANTFVRRQTRESATIFEVATGMLEGDGPFAGHGHLVRLVIEA